MNEAGFEVPVKRNKPKTALIVLLTALITLAICAGLLLLLPKRGTASGVGSSTGANLPESSGSADKLTVAEPIRNPDAELRGIFIATVVNINYPSKPGLDANTQKSELDAIIETCLEANLNAIYFQVRPASDALYESDIFPTSEYLTGKQGAPLEFDPLEYLVNTAHENNIEVHAWVNPLRITTGSQSAPKTDPKTLAEGHPARENPELAVAYADGRLYYNVGLPEVRTLVADGVREIVKKYAVDGVIFDDYFYPYPVSVKSGNKTVIAEFDDKAAFKKYGGKLKLDDWRRQNINQMVESCYEAVKSVRESCEFGIAPFGIWRNDDGKNGGSETSGLESYSAIYCDPVAWVEGGYVDYLAPQIYWRFSTSVARYDVLVRWWNTLLDGTDVDLYISHGVHNYASGWENAENEFRNQVEFARAELAYRGSILYGYAALKDNAQGLMDETRAVFSESIIHTDPVSNGRDLILSIPYENSYIDGTGTFLLGTSDPTESLYIDGEKVGRTKSGYFSTYLPLKKGKNTFVFEHKGEKREFVINGGTQPTSTAIYYAKLDSYKIAATTPSSAHFTTDGTLKLSVTAPSGSSVTATLGGTTYKLSPTLYPPNQDKYMKEVYTATIKLTKPASGEIKNLGEITFKAVRMKESATVKSGQIRIGGTGASIPVEINKNDTELKVQTNSWYYDDFSVQSKGARDNAVSLNEGWYKLRCGGYVAAENITELEGETAFGLARLSEPVIERDARATYIRFKSDVSVPVNCYVDNGEFAIAFYNVDTKNAPTLEYVKNPIFTSVRGDKSTKAYSYKYFFELYNVENFYGFDVIYENGTITIELTNPTSLPDSERPLEGKTIILDAGHGGKNPGALGPLGAAEGALNESAFNLEIVMAAVPKLEELGAKVVLIRDRDCEIDVPINDRMQTLIDVDPDMCISIHQNSMPYTTDVTKIRGLVGLYWANSGYMLTDVMGEVMSDALNKLDRSPTRQRLAMVRNPKFPATLIETCFITNVEEYERMMRPGAIDEIAASLADGVLAYYKAQEKYLIN